MLAQQQMSVCGYCGFVINDGTAPVSHGFCGSAACMRIIRRIDPWPDRYDVLWNGVRVGETLASSLQHAQERAAREYAHYGPVTVARVQDDPNG